MPKLKKLIVRNDCKSKGYKLGIIISKKLLKQNKKYLDRYSLHSLVNLYKNYRCIDGQEADDFWNGIHKGLKENKIHVTYKNSKNL